jgi:hypothetical protein
VVLGLAQRPRSLLHVLGFGVLLAAPWLFNPLQDHLLFYLSPGYLGKGGLAHVYPWGYHYDGLAVMWAGDSWLNTGDRGLMLVGLRLGRAVVAAGTLGLVAVAVGGLVRWWRGGRNVGLATFGLPMALLGLAVIPGMMFLHDKDHPYQFFKILITVSPLFAFGTVVLGTIIAGGMERFSRFGAWARLSTGVVWLPVLVGIALAGLNSYRLGMQSARPEEYTRHPHMFRMQQHAALTDDFRELRQELESLRGQKILMRPWGRLPYVSQLWSCYFGRFNQLWLADPIFNDGFNLLDNPNLANLADMTQLPADCLVLSPTKTMFLQPPSSLPATAIVWQGASHMLWKWDRRPWACLTDVDRPEPNFGSWVWLTDIETTFRLFATEPGVVNLTVGLDAGPCIDPSEKLRLLVKDPRGTVSVVESPPGRLVLPIHLERGVSTVTVKALNPRRRTLDNDPRPLLIAFCIHELEFRPLSDRKDVSPLVGN